jgi:hypothetical protein
MQKIFESFDIIFGIEERKERKSCFQRLFQSITRKKRPSTTAMENIRKMYKGLLADDSTRGFRVHNRLFDYELLHEKCRRESKKEYNLMSDFERLVKLLTSFVEEPEEPCCEIEVTIEVPRPKKLRKVTTYDKITILERWVKIGFQMYRRQLDVFTGDEYIVVDGDVYNIKRDRYGREYLA